MGWPDRALVLVMAILAVNRISCIQFYPDDPPERYVTEEEAERFFFKLDRDYAARNNRINGTSETRDNIGGIENSGIEEYSGYAQQAHARAKAGKPTTKPKTKSKGTVQQTPKIEDKLKAVVTKLFEKHFTKDGSKFKPKLAPFKSDLINRRAKLKKNQKTSTTNPCGYKSSITLTGQTFIDFYGVELEGSLKRPKTIIQKILERAEQKLNDRLNPGQSPKQDLPQDLPQKKTISILVDVCKPAVPTVGTRVAPIGLVTLSDTELLKKIEITITGQIKLLNLKLPTKNPNAQQIAADNVQDLAMMQTIISKAFGSEDLDVDFGVGAMVEKDILIMQNVAESIDGIAELSGYPINLAEKVTEFTQNVTKFFSDLTIGGTVSADTQNVHFMIKYAPLEDAPIIPDTNINVTDVTLILELESGKFEINMPKKSASGGSSASGAPSGTSTGSSSGDPASGTSTGSSTDAETEADKPGITFYMKTDTDLLTLISDNVTTFLEDYFPIETSSWCLLGNTKETNFYGLIKKDIIHNCLNNPAVVKAATNGDATVTARVPYVKSLNFASMKRSSDTADTEALTATEPVPDPEVERNMANSEATDITNEKLAKGLYLTTIVDLTAVGMKCYGDSEELFQDGKNTFKSWKKVNEEKKKAAATSAAAKNQKPKTSLRAFKRGAPQTAKDPVVFLHPIQLAITTGTTQPAETRTDKPADTGTGTAKPADTGTGTDKPAGTGKQLTVRLPQGSEDISNFCRFCLLGMFVNAPNYLSDGNIKIDRFVYDFDTKAYTLGVSVKSGAEFRGMKIEEFNFKIVKSPKKTTKPVGRSPPGGGTKKPSEKPATDLETRIEGVAKVKIGDSKVELAIKKHTDMWILNIAADSFTLGDILKGEEDTEIKSEPDSDSVEALSETETDVSDPGKKRQISAESDAETDAGSDDGSEEVEEVDSSLLDMFKNTGVQFFDVNIEKHLPIKRGQIHSLIAVRCQPIILGFDHLFFNAKFIKKKASDPWQWAVGVYMASADFSSMMKTIKGEDGDETASSLSFLKGLSAIVAYNHFDKSIKIARDTDWDADVTILIPTPVVTKKPDQKKGKSKKTGTSSQLVARGPKTRKATKKTNNPETLAFPGFENEFILKRKEFGFGLFWTIPDVNITGSEGDDCRNSPLCSFLSKTLPKDTTIMIQGKMTRTSFTLTASMTGGMYFMRKDHSILALTEAKLSIKVGVMAPEFKISAKLQYSYNDEKTGGILTSVEDALKDKQATTTMVFEGGVEITPTHIKLLFNMQGFVKLPDYFAFGNVNLEFGITMAAGFPTFAFGATFFLGDFTKEEQAGNMKDVNGVKDKYPHLIELTGYFGINPADPTKNYIYGSVNKLTLVDICEAFDYGDWLESVPGFIKKSGFSAETSVSLSSSVDEVEVVGGIIIQSGFALKGTFNFLGFEMFSDIEIGKDKFDLTIETSPIDWAWGWIQAFRSEADQKNGPKFSIKLDSDGVAMTAEMYINALKAVQGSAKISIDGMKMSIEVSVTLYQLFTVDFKFQTFGDDGLFSVGATIDVGTFTSWLANLCKAFVQGLTGTVTAISEGISKIAADNEKRLADAKKKVQTWEGSVSKWKESLKARKLQLEKETAAELTSCDCGKICVPFLTIKRKCIWVWVAYLPCPWPDPCYSKITDPFCVLGCGAKKAWSAMVKWGKKALLEIGMALSDGANALLGIAGGFLEAVEGFNDFVTRVSTAVTTGVRNLELLATTGIESFFDGLETVGLKAEITKDFSACVSYEVTWKTSTPPTEGDVCLNVLSLATTFTNLIMGQPYFKNTIEKEEKALPEYEKKLKEVQAEVEEIKDKETETGSNIDDTAKMDKFEQVQHAMKRSDVTHHDLKEHYAELKPILDKLPKRENHQRSRVEKDILNYIRNSPVEKYDPRDDPGFRSFINRGPWHFNVRDEISHFVPTFIKNETSHSTWKRTLQFDSKLSPCNKMKRALNGFSDITHGLMDFTKSVDYTKSELEKASVGRKDKIAKLHREIEKQVLKYNITGEERESLNYIYQNALRGDAAFTKRTDIAIQRSTSKTLPLVRDQINGLLRRDFGKNFYEMAEVMHGHALDGYKRSGIPHAEDVRGETLLTNIKENLQDIISGEDDYDDDEDEDGDENVNVVTLPKRLASVKKDIISMQSFANRCA